MHYRPKDNGWMLIIMLSLICVWKLNQIIVFKFKEKQKIEHLSKNQYQTCTRNDMAGTLYLPFLRMSSILYHFRRQNFNVNEILPASLSICTILYYKHIINRYIPLLLGSSHSLKMHDAETLHVIPTKKLQNKPKTIIQKQIYTLYNIKL